MRITAARRDDIIQRRDEYDAQMQRFIDRETELEDQYDTAYDTATKKVEQAISNEIGATSLSLSIKVSTGISYRGRKGWECRIECNDRNKFDDNVALSWNWSASLDENGNVIKDSGSWSGLKAITPEQIADLEESVRVLKILNNMDWPTILSSDVVKYSDYIDKEASEQLRALRKDRPDFEAELRDAELAELVNTNTAVELTDDAYWRGKVYMLVSGLTDKFVKGYVFPASYIEGRFGTPKTADELRNTLEERRVAKSKLVHDGEGSYSTIVLS